MSKNQSNNKKGPIFLCNNKSIADRYLWDCKTKRMLIITDLWWVCVTLWLLLWIDLLYIYQGSDVLDMSDETQICSRDFTVAICKFQ